MSKKLNNLILVSILILLFFSQNSFGISKSTYSIPKSTLHAENIDTAKFNVALQYIEDSVKGVRSIVILRNGKLVFEKYYHIYNIDTTYLIFSSTKSIMSILTGIAIQDGLIKGGVKAKVINFFPEIQFDNLTDNKKLMTIGDLLTMRSGLKWDNTSDDFYDNKNPLKFILDKPMDTIPGCKWHYNDGAAHILSNIITKVSGKSTLEFAKEYLFGPLGITTYNWQVDCKGVCYGGYGLFIKPKDLAKIGLLYLNNGMWNGSRLIKKDWVQASTDSITSTDWQDDGKYGYLWWVNDFGGYASRGLYGQDMYVIPDKNLIVVFTSALNAATAAKSLNTIVKNYLLPSIN